MLWREHAPVTGSSSNNCCCKVGSCRGTANTRHLILAIILCVTCLHLHKMIQHFSMAHSEIHTPEISSQSRVQRSTVSKPPLNVSLLSRSPQKLKPTVPTRFEHAPIKGDKSPYKCSLHTNATHKWSKARMVLFQRNGGKQLATWVKHYSHVLPPDALVLIDHESTDPWTKSLLQKYASLGSHVWHCKGSYENGRATMWSSIARVYQHDSDYIFPLDVDELVTINDNSYSMSETETDTTTIITSDTKRQRRLVWDAHSFYHALDRLSTAGKPFKMEQVDVVPGDCHLPSSYIRHDQDQLFPSPVCALTHAVRKTEPIPYGCMDKNFCRGPDFVQTDMGNHFLVTNRTATKVPDLQSRGYNIFERCQQDGIYQWYEPSPLVVLHMQRLEFTDWFLHFVRGASMHHYTTHDKLNQTACSTALAPHYCYQWLEFMHHGFNIDAIRPKFQYRYCPRADALSSPGLSPIANVFDHACAR
jgi:hypothetical protein